VAEMVLRMLQTCWSEAKQVVERGLEVQY
jgi:hypothetical protein